MNRSVLGEIQQCQQQQMMAESPNWWNIMNNNIKPPLSHPNSSIFLAHPSNLFPQFISPPPSPPPPSSSSASLASSSSWNDNQELPAGSWSQLLLGGLVGEEEDKLGQSNVQPKKLEINWEEHLLRRHTPTSTVVDVNLQTSPVNSYVYGHGNVDQLIQTASKPTWSQLMPVSSAKSCVTTLSSSNMLDFSTKFDVMRHVPPDHSSECNSGTTGSGSPAKKARVQLQPSSTQSTFKVRKEKLGDRIAALHQIVSPFGKTDTASVLLEAIGYIRFLHSQIEALSLPYLGSGSGNMRQQLAQSKERNCLFPEDPGQLLNGNCMKRKGASDHQDSHEEPKKDLRSRGLCLVPVSCTLQIGSDNSADYWAPAALDRGFR